MRNKQMQNKIKNIIQNKREIRRINLHLIIYNFHHREFDF